MCLTPCDSTGSCMGGCGAEKRKAGWSRRKVGRFTGRLNCASGTAWCGTALQHLNNNWQLRITFAALPTQIYQQVLESSKFLTMTDEIQPPFDRLDMICLVSLSKG